MTDALIELDATTDHAEPQPLETQTDAAADQLVSKGRELLLEVAPELRDLPLYLIRHPAHLPPPQDTAAYAVARGEHIGIRDHLRATGQWQGCGETIVLCDPLPDDWISMAAMLLHECGHILPVRPWAPEVEPTDEQRRQQEADLAAWSAGDDTPMYTCPITPWTGHGLFYIRRVLHLHYRAMWQGVALPLNFMFNGLRYSLSQTHRYLSALGGEPFDMRWRTFKEINTTPPPIAFQELFFADAAAWESRQARRQQRANSPTEKE